ncbi:MAG: diguanylate cyclase [Candidatus Sulfotelmatobacter sp.]|jgi:diguanylate cyclase (GGDEF)-like protein
MPVELKTKVNFALSLALVALAGIGWLSLRQSQNLTEADRWVSHTRDVLETSESFRSHLSEAGIARRVFLQGDSKQIDVFNAAVSASLADFKTLQALTADNPEQQKRLDRLEPMVHERLSALEKSIAAHRLAANDEALQNNVTNQQTSVVAQLAEQTREFQNVERELLRQRSSQVRESAQRTSRDNSILSLAVMCFIVIAAAGLNRELSQRKQTEQAIAQQKSLLQSILDTCNDAIIVADGTGKIILRNPAALRMHSDLVDRVGEEVPSKLGYYRPDTKTLFPYQDLPLSRALQGEHVDNVEMCLHPACEPEVRWALGSSRPLINEEKILGAVVFYRDITERKELENKLASYTEELKASNVELQKAQVALEQLASVDELTGLHNRRGFLALAAQSIKLAHRSQKSFALVFADLDGLKKINDTLGHADGDLAISDAAHVLSDSFRHCDVLGRLGGDEFAILMSDADEQSAQIVKKRLADKVDKLNAERHRPYTLSLSVGMMICNSDEKVSLEVLLSRADALMYEEKKKKGANRAVYVAGNSFARNRG